MKDTGKTTGILLLNLGGPDSLDAVGPFLNNLFSDREIIKLGPPFLQKPLARLISILRTKKIREMYKQIGGKSPLLDITKAQAEALEKELNVERRTPDVVQRTTVDAPRATRDTQRFKVYIGMRYWHPFIGKTVDDIVNDGITDLIVLSLYPHYSKATTGSAVNEFNRHVKDRKLSIRYIINEWYDFPPYVDALAELIAEGVSEFKGKDYEILFSAHSLPQSFIDEGDPYLDHIKATVEKVNERLSSEPYNMAGIRSHLSFQSKTGPVKWLEPSTEDMIINLSKKGCRNLLVVPVSFISDHIETLYEIDIQYKELAERNGIKLTRCKSCNVTEKFILALRELVKQKIDI